MFNRRTLFKTIAVGALTPWNEVLTPLEESVSTVSTVSTDMFVPEFWAKESVSILKENMVVGKCIYKDFERSK